MLTISLDGGLRTEDRREFQAHCLNSDGVLFPTDLVDLRLDLHNQAREVAPAKEPERPSFFHINKFKGAAMTEMSGRFFANGHELTMDEYREHLQNRRIKRVENRIASQKQSFFWLGHALHLPTTFDLSGMLREIGINGSAQFYNEPIVIKKREGGTRIIISPRPELKLVQRRINRLLLRTFPRNSNTFGYTGGSCRDVALRHAEYASTFKFDVRDAFFLVGFHEIKDAVTRHLRQPEGFSKTLAHWIAQLSTYSPPPDIVLERFPRMKSFLPQGAPTSPILFHLAMKPLDEKLVRVAERVGGIVSRYADNYYFGVNTSRFSKKFERMIICDANKRLIPIHKARRIDQGELCRILGYNVLEGRVTNTREFRNDLRGALYVLRTKLERGLEWHEAYARVRGFMGFAMNLPDGLQKAYEQCEKLIESK